MRGPVHLRALDKQEEAPAAALVTAGQQLDGLARHLGQGRFRRGGLGPVQVVGHGIWGESAPHLAGADLQHFVACRDDGVAMGLQHVDQVLHVLALAPLHLLGQQVLQSTGQHHVHVVVDLLLGQLVVVVPVVPV